MNTYTAEELIEMITIAHAQRKQAYKMRMPKVVTSEINNRIFDLNQMLIKAEGN